VAEQHYARIAAEDGPSGKGINSFLALSRERAMAQAAKIDALAAKGEPLPPLARRFCKATNLLMMRRR
jgi:aspartyl-tRNA(Asn)/glutamyl-tRNA(Gln) amidotransferase subunit A